MSVRIVLIAAGVVGLLFGLMFLLGAESAIQSFSLGGSTVPERLFARSLGAAIVSISLINLIASTDRRSSALRAIVIGNVAIHVLSFIVDFSESYTRNGGVYVGLAVHVIFVIAFGWVLLNWNKAAKP